MALQKCLFHINYMLPGCLIIFPTGIPAERICKLVEKFAFLLEHLQLQMLSQPRVSLIKDLHVSLCLGSKISEEVLRLVYRVFSDDLLGHSQTFFLSRLLIIGVLIAAQADQEALLLVFVAVR